MLLSQSALHSVTHFPLIVFLLKADSQSSLSAEVDAVTIQIHGEVSAIYISSRNVQLLRPPRNVFE